MCYENYHVPGISWIYMLCVGVLLKYRMSGIFSTRCHVSSTPVYVMSPLSLCAPALCIFVHTCYVGWRHPNDQYLLHTHFKSIFHFLLLFSDTAFVTYTRSSIAIGCYRCWKKTPLFPTRIVTAPVHFVLLRNCRCVFTFDMDSYWFMRHVLCTPSKLHSQTSRNLFPPRYIPFPYFLSLLPFTNMAFGILSCFSCLEGRCSAESPCFFGRTDTIFQCPKSRLFSDDPITFEQCINKDITASAYASDPLLDARDSVPLYGVPPPKRIKRIWKKVTTSKKDFVKHICIFELAPDTFEHHQVHVHIWLHILLGFFTNSSTLLFHTAWIGSKRRSLS